jgi:hypothetical protein
VYSRETVCVTAIRAIVDDDVVDDDDDMMCNP